MTASAAGRSAAPGRSTQPDAGAIYRWLAAARRSPSVGQRAQTVYIAVVVTAIFGVLVYGTASSALAAVIDPPAIARWGPSLMLLVLLGAGHWGTLQGPVVFSPADVTYLLGAPLVRAALVARPLRRALVLGLLAGALVAGVVVVGLTGDGRSAAVARCLGLVAGVGLAGVSCVALAFLVSIDSRAERVLRVASWPIVAVAGGLVVCAFAAGRAGRTVALWSGPWGWAVQAGAGVGTGEWIGALIALAVAAVAAVGIAWRRRGAGETERFVRRAEGRNRLEASLMDLNLRTGRRNLAEVAGPAGRGGDERGRRVRGLRWLRSRARVVGRRAPEAAVVWRDAVTAAQLPGRVVLSALLAAGGGALVLLDVAQPVAVVAGALLIYAAAAWLLEPMRIELDVPSRAAVFLGVRPGRALLAHAILPSVVVSAAVVVCAVALALAGRLAGGELAPALVAVITAPAVTCCAGMSARRGGRLPTDVLIAAVTSDPSGGGIVLLGWLLLWPAVAAAVVYVPVRAIHGSAASVAVAVAASVAAAVVQGRDPRES